MCMAYIALRFYTHTAFTYRRLMSLIITTNIIYPLAMAFGGATFAQMLSHFPCKSIEVPEILAFTPKCRF